MSAEHPPLRTFTVRTIETQTDGTIGYRNVTVKSHLVFNNADRGEGLVFRRYQDDDVRTRIVASFEPGTFINFVEKENGESRSTRRRK